jgi:hypothetical protein
LSSSLLSILGNQHAGTYHGTNNVVASEVRIDPSLNAISGDLFFLQRDESGTTVPSYMYSFISLDLEVEQTNVIKIKGNINFFRYTTLEGTIELTLNNDLIILTLSFKNRLTNPRPTISVFQLQKVSPFFRELDLETDFMTGTRKLPIFNTHSVSTRPPDLSNEDLSLKSLFAKAGVNVKESIHSNVIQVNPNETWDESELHAIMEVNMSNFLNAPQWRLYLLIATRFENPRVLGIIYDTTDDVPRQGSAVFTKHRMIDGDSPEHRREYLYTTLHELGHAFNLYHSFHKGLEGPFEFPRPDSLSVMNYPQLHPHGANAPPNYDGSEGFWSQFRFSFDEGDLLHIRHHDLLEVIMGGRPFGDEGHFKDRFWSSFTRPKNLLELTIRSKKVFEFGEPVLVEAKLKNISSHNLNIPSTLNIKDGFVFTSIDGPDGKSKPYKPMITRCGIAETVKLKPSESKYEDLHLNYGRDGFYFSSPGKYKIQALISSLNGILKSNIHEILIAEPQSINEHKRMSNMFTRNNGQYLYLKGSDYLSSAEKELTTLRNDLNDTNLARYIEFYMGSKYSRKFKSVVNGKIKSREPKYDEASKHLETSISNTRSEEIAFDNILLNRVMSQLADIQQTIGKMTKAKDTVAELLDHMKKRKVTESVIKELEQKRDSIRKNK